MARPPIGSFLSVFTTGGGGGGGSDGKEGCFAVARGGRQEGPGGRNCRSHMEAGLLFGGGSFFVGAIKGHGNSTNDARDRLAGAIN